MVLYLLNMFGAAVFAVSGALTAGRKSLDPFGVIVIAVITAIGGGTIRDLLLDIRPIFWIADPTYLVVILSAALATLVYARFRQPPRGSLLVADAFGLALFTVTGAQTAEAAEVSGLIVILMGTITGVAGGILRDVLCAEIPLILRREIYATASIAGASVYVLWNELAPGSQTAVLTPMALIFALRLAAIRLDLHVPPVAPKDRDV
ncbi:MAG TPA: trimeric intracellular cation channel family protein [Rubrobacteraceae bacterium]|nr:trimeric intracellular cation channel family protein [Rubrobacteraceae bacterium]